MSKQVKRMMIDSIQSKMGVTRELLVVDISRVSAISVNRIRLHLADRGVQLVCVRNAVAILALRDLGIQCASQLLVGPSAIVIGADDIATLSKEVSRCVEQDKGFEIRSGISGELVLSRNDINTLISSPGRLELLSLLSGQIGGTGSELVTTLTVPHGSIISQIDRLGLR